MAKVAFTGNTGYRILIDPKFIVSIHEKSKMEGTLIITVSESINVKHTFDEVNDLLKNEEDKK